MTRCQENGDFAGLSETLSSEQITELVEPNVLVEDDAMYQSKKFTHVRLEHEKKINTAYLHLSLRCNLACEYCYQKDNLNVKPDLSTWRWIEALRILKSVGAERVHFTGGEPYLHSGLADIARYAKSLGLHISLLTNGSLMTADDEALKYADVVIVSLDGLNESLRKGLDHNRVFDAILSAFGRYPEKIRVRSVVTRGREEEVKVLGRKLANTGVPHIEVVCAPSSVDDFGMIPDYKKYGLASPECMNADCGAGASIIALDSRGDVYPCQTLLSPDMAIANIFDSHWYERYLNCKVGEELRSFDPYNDPVCKDCDVVHLCMGGCRSIPFQVYKNFSSRPDFLCDYYRMCAEQWIRKAE